MSAPRGGRIESLEGLRGVAALVVVVFHALDLLALPPSVRVALSTSPLGVLANGPAAVHVFFVLSGYVLAISRERDRGPRDLAGYYAKRVLRIHPPYVGALLVAWLAGFVHALPGFADARWVGALRPVHISPDQLAVALLFPSKAFWQLPVGWSLYVEMAMSLVFPLLLRLGRRTQPLLMVGVAALFLEPPHPWLGFTRYGLDFALGALAFLERDRLAAALDRWPRFAPLLLGVGAVALLQAPGWVAWGSQGYPPLQHAHSTWTLVSLALGSLLLVVLAVQAAALRRWLSTRPVLFLGRVSYSLYLLHLTVFFLVAGALGGRLEPLPGAAALGLAAVASVGLAAAFERWVEAPSQRLGRALARGVSGSRDGAR